MERSLCKEGNHIMERDEKNGPRARIKVHSAQKVVRENEEKMNEERQRRYRVKKGSIHILHISNQNLLKKQNTEVSERCDREYSIWLKCWRGGVAPCNR